MSNGCASKDIITFLKEKSGAKSVHVVSAAPMIRNECYYAVDLKRDLIANNKTIKEIRGIVNLRNS
ncbi:MAG: hypothetical protein JW791_00340 [Nanoarchaeota archaeon]|nr:hypothetical protein [Nanoarchaeota archaeon]